MRFLPILLLILLSDLCFAQQSDLSAELIDHIQLRIADGVNTSIAIGIIDQAGPRYYSFGLKKEKGRKVDEHTVYEIGSISKVFTAILLADEIVHNEMKADDPIANYLPPSVKVPAFSGGGPVIALGNLSDHTSSLPRLPANMNPADPQNPYADYTVDMLYDFLSGYNLPREVGSQFEYSNLAVGLLGHILALNAGTSYEALLHEKITAPLHMKETAISLSGVMKKNLAAGYAMGMKVENWDLPAFEGAGALRSTASDMLLFLEANMALNNASLNQAMKLSQTPRHNLAGGSSVGLGWIIEEGGTETIYMHTGGTGGYRSYVGFIKEAGKGVVVLTNSDVGVEDIGRYLLDPKTKLQDFRPSITLKLRQIIDSEGTKDLFEKYIKLRNSNRYEINEEKINALGYHYLNYNKLDAALLLFEINMDAFPDAFNVYDSYGEALLKSGQKERAIDNYKKSIKINPLNANALDVLTSLGVEVEREEVKEAETILASYVGTYELVPGFNIVITRDGTQLFGQATGQPVFELFAKTDTDFYLTVVDAQVIFSKDDNGHVMMTLYQNGQVLPGKKIL